MYDSQFFYEARAMRQKQGLDSNGNQLPSPAASLHDS